MSGNRRVLTYVIIALIVGAALAVAVALARSSDSASGSPENAGAATASPSVYSEGADASALAAADPAKEQPLLDKFTSKDPFGVTSTATPTPTPTSTSTSSSSLSAKVKVDGTSYNVVQGDQVPGGSAAEFTVTSITSGDVTFKVIDGTLENGDKSFPVNLGEAVRVTLDSGVSYDISVVSIGSSSSGSSSSGHSISVLSISSQNSTALVTISVDGTTYSDKKVGAVFDTAWGQIEVLSIDVGGQTVVILHGDERITLDAGQVIVK